MKRVRLDTSRLILIIAGFSACAISGCAGATRLPTRARGAAGQDFQKKQLDFAFLDEPGTSRDEVLRRLNIIDTTYSNPRLFWARWGESKWGYWWIIAGGNTAAGDARRVWRHHNLLVLFDEEGFVQKKLFFDDDAALWRELRAELTDAPPLDLTQPIVLNASACCWLTTISLTPESVEVGRRKGKTPVDISPQQIVRVSHNRTPSKGSAVNTTCHALHMKEKTPVGKTIHFCADAPSVAALFQYLHEFGPKDMGWQ